MSKKILSNILNFALAKEAQEIVIFRQKQEITFDYFSENKTYHLSLPKKLKDDFFKVLNRILNLSSGQLITKKYYKIPHQEDFLPVYITVLPDNSQEKIIVKLAKKTQKTWYLKQLGLETNDRKILENVLKKKSGLIIISSPPGQGKSSSLRTLISELNDPHYNLYYLGAKLSKKFPGINILKANLKNWEKLRHHDSDLIFVDSPQEKENLKQALITAATGRLVIMTLNAQNFQEVIKKIKKLKLPPSLIKDSLKLIIKQKLIPIKHSQRKYQQKSTASERQLIGKFELLKL